MNSTVLPVAANDDAGRGRWDMTVLELAIFLSVHRRPRAPDRGEIAGSVGEWFSGEVPPATLGAAIARMIGNAWLAPVGDQIKATADGREVARPLLHGLVLMLDHGTKLIDVALMMAVLRLTKGELDDRCTT